MYIMVILKNKKDYDMCGNRQHNAFATTNKFDCKRKEYP